MKSKRPAAWRPSSQTAEKQGARETLDQKTAQAVRQSKTDTAQAKADNLVEDYKGRLNPYVKAMKQRGYFGEAMKLQAQQQAQVQNQNNQTENTQAQQAKQGEAKPVAPVSPKIGIDPVVANPGKPTDLNHGLDLPSGDYISVSKEVKPDDSDQESRAPDITSAVRPSPVMNSGVS